MVKKVLPADHPISEDHIACIVAIIYKLWLVVVSHVRRTALATDGLRWSNHLSETCRCGLERHYTSIHTACWPMLLLVSVSKGC